MQIREFSIRNFMPFQDEIRIEFPTDPNRNVIVIFGDNMRGKTSILNALRWIVYGKALGRHMRDISPLDLVNKDSAAAGEYIVEGKIVFEADSHVYVLSRRMEKRNLVLIPNKAEDYSVTLRLQKDSEILTNDVIEYELSKYIPEQISRFFLFDGELLQEYENLLIEGSEQGSKIKDAIEQILGVPTLSNCHDDIALLLKTAQKKLNIEQSHTKDLEEKAAKQASFQKQQDSYERDIDELKMKLEQVKKERAGLDDELDNVERIYQAKASLDEYLRKQKENNEKKKKIELDQVELLKDAWRDLVRPMLVERRQQLLTEHDGMKKEVDKLSENKYKIRELESIVANSVCRTCGQQINSEYLKKAGIKLGELQAALHGMDVDQSKLVEYSTAISEIDNITRTTVAKQLIAFSKEQTQIEIEMVRIENIIEEKKEIVKGYDTADIAKKRSYRDGLLKEETQIEVKIKEQEKKYEEITRQLAILSKVMSSDANIRMSKTARSVSLCTDLEVVFNKSISFLRDELRDRVASKANEAFLEMTTQKMYRGLSINTNYGLSILDDKGNPVNVRSAGAEQVVALSLIDGLNRTGRAAGPIIMDTPFGRLDLKHRDNILRYLPTTTKQLVLLVHDGEIRKESDLAVISDRIFARYEIKGISPRQSRIERML